MCVIPGGLTPYLQAGDIGIYKTFKDLLYMEINAWKESDKVEYTRFSNPRMPSVDGSRRRGVTLTAKRWPIPSLQQALLTTWEASGEAEQDEGDFNLDELHDALDDIALIDE
ncbi:hypothetical protein PC113_g25291 [Phytophthora cactorum]|uniref:DDE-1 domain-containing protein n=1 Tax=Phytophthora cactorum TaxID=29920 RepID=A0A8T0XPX5_9STRA|nr:hypothetical protein PC113_g25291 [Phytophthora cactorum]KAG4035889.1 hypothetical protein PC123_g28543 [Phytophthora cactorum]